MDITSFNQIIASRRSVFPKDYKAEKIDDQIIWQILEKCKLGTDTQNDSTMEI